MSFFINSQYFTIGTKVLTKCTGEKSIKTLEPSFINLIIKKYHE